MNLMIRMAQSLTMTKMTEKVVAQVGDRDHRWLKNDEDLPRRVLPVPRILIPQLQVRIIHPQEAQVHLNWLLPLHTVL